MQDYSSVESIMNEVERKIELELEEIEYLENVSISHIHSIEHLNQAWNVPLDISIIGSSSIKGKISIFVKKVINKLIRWRLHFVIENQKQFNASAVQTINYLNNEINLLRNQIESSQDEISSLKGELELKKSKVSHEDLDNNSINYLEFENYFRGKKDLIRENFEHYLKYLNKGMKILDLGCGRGELIELLVAHGFDASGVDSNPDMVKHCKLNNLSVIQDDIIHYLKSTNEKYDCIFISQVVEHMKINTLLEFVSLCHQKLNNNGLLIIETPNPETILVSSYTFYLDFTHTKPIPAIFLKYLLESKNFNVIDTLYLHPFPENEKLLELVSDNHQLNLNFKTLNKLIYGARDYAIIASKMEGDLFNE